MRHNQCEILIVDGGGRCSYCLQYRFSLRAMAFKQKKVQSASMVDHASHANYRFLRNDQLKERLQHSHSKVRAESKKVERLKKKLHGRNFQFEA